jgi:hypothetical protein
MISNDTAVAQSGWLGCVGGLEMSSFLLVCAVVASLAVGVFAAQGVCMLIFRAFRVPVRQPAEPKLARTAIADLGSMRG